MSRSLKKGPYVNERILKRVLAMKTGDKTPLKLWDRACVITPEMVGFVFGVHDGRKHVSISVSENMVGHRFGEFAPTRKFVAHGGKMAKAQATK